MSYIKTRWLNLDPNTLNSGTKVTAAKMNKIEDGIDRASKEIDKINKAIEDGSIGGSTDLSNYYTKIETDTLIENIGIPSEVSNNILIPVEYPISVSDWIFNSNDYEYSLVHTSILHKKQISVKAFFEDDEIFVGVEYISPTTLKIFNDEAENITVVVMERIKKGGNKLV